MSHSVYYKNFKQSLLVGLDYREIGNFVLFRDKMGINLLTKEAYKVWKKSKEKEDFTKFNIKKKIDKKNPPPIAPISDDELSFIE